MKTYVEPAAPDVIGKNKFANLIEDDNDDDSAASDNEA